MSTQLPLQVNQSIIDLVFADNEVQKRAKELMKESHTKLWDEIHAQYPDLEGEGSLELKCEFADQGIVMLVKHECEHKGMPDALLKLLSSLKELKDVKDVN